MLFMKKIKMIAASIMFAFVAVCPMSAMTQPTESNLQSTELPEDVEPLRYTSTATGLSFIVPSNSLEQQDKVDGVIIVTEDEMFQVTAIPFNVKKESKETIAESILTLAEAAKIDLNKSERVEGDNELVSYSAECADYGNGGGALVGVANVKGTELGYFITIVASADYVEYAGAVLKSLTFDPDAVEE